MGAQGPSQGLYSGDMDKDPKRDWDAAWMALEKDMEKSDNGFRAWSPAPEEEEPFDPSELPDAEPLAPASRPDLARLSFLVTGAVAVLYILGLFDILTFSRDWWLIFGTIGLVGAAVGVYFSSPWAHRPDDDGTRV